MTSVPPAYEKYLDDNFPDWRDFNVHFSEVLSMAQERILEDRQKRLLHIKSLMGLSLRQESELQKVNQSLLRSSRVNRRLHWIGLLKGWK